MASATCFLAYLDPGTGSLILQAILAMLFSTGVILRRYLVKPFHWLFSRKKKQPATSAELFE